MPPEAERGIVGFDHVSLPLQHTEAMVAFYRGLGLDVAEKQQLVSVYLGDQMINFHRPEVWQRDGFTLRAPAATPPCGRNCVCPSAPSTPEFGEDRFARFDDLTGARENLHSVRQIDVDPAAETDYAKTIAPAYGLSFLHVTHDPPRHEPGDLYDPNVLTALSSQA